MSNETRDNPVSHEQEKQGEPNEWEKCTVRLSITFFPDDSSEGGRQVILGCNTHNDPPLLETTREAELGTLPPVVVGLLERLKERLLQQETEKKIKAAEQKYRVKNSDGQAPLALLAEENAQAGTLPEGCVSPPAEIGDRSGPASGKQQSLFG